MIDINQFKDRVVDQNIDVDGAYGSQCYDLSAQWIIQNGWGTGYYCQWSGGVRDLIEHFDEIGGIDRSKVMCVLNNPYDPNQLPKAGDIIVYNWGTYGHVEIVIDARVDGMTVLGQNLGSSDGIGYDDRTQLVENRQYKNVLGWVTPIIIEPKPIEIPKPIIEPTPPKQQINNTDLQKIKEYIQEPKIIQTEIKEPIKEVNQEVKDNRTNIKSFATNIILSVTNKLNSRKLWVAVIGISIPFINKKLGLEIGTEQVLGMFGLCSSYVIGQGIADNGKQ